MSDGEETIFEFPLWPKQRLLLISHATEILWGGAAGPGKSHGTRAACLAWCVAVPGINIYLFRREYQDLIKNHMEGPTGFRALLQPLVAMGRVIIREKEIEFVQERSKIFLCHCQHEKDVFGYQGAEMHVLILEEATQFTEFQIKYLRSRVRMPDTIEIPDQFLLPERYQTTPGKRRYCFPRVVYPTNPGGVGHAYLKTAIFDPAQKLEQYETWEAPDSDGGFIRQFVPARLTDNPSVNPEEYAKRLKGIGSPQYVRALLEGDWSVILGAFFAELSEEKHRIPDILVPDHWFRYCWYDWGYASPACNLWFAVADGEATWTMEEEQITLPRGALVIYRELYICNPDNKAQGARLSNREQARLIKKASGRENISGYLADNRPFQNNGGTFPAQEFKEEGVNLIQGDDSRSAWALVHSRLQAEPQPLLYITKSCVHTWRTMGTLQTSPTKPEDADDGGEDHAPDCVRGGCTVRRIVKDRVLPNEERIQQAVREKPTMAKLMRNRVVTGE